MLAFTYETLPCRVVFGPGRIAALADEVARLGARRALVLSTPGKRALAEQAARRLGERAAGIYDRAVMHVPIEVAEAGRAEAQRRRRRLLRRDRRRHHDRPRQGDRARDRPADRRDPDHLLRLRDDPGPGHHRGRRQAHAARPEDAAADRDLRPGAHARAAARRLRHLGHERDRALRRGALCRERQPDHLADGRGGHPGARREPAASWSARPTTSRPARRRSTAPGSPAPRSARSAWGCTTSSATCSAAASTCRTPRPTR